MKHCLQIGIFLISIIICSNSSNNESLEVRPKSNFEKELDEMIDIRLCISKNYSLGKRSEKKCVLLDINIMKKLNYLKKDNQLSIIISINKKYSEYLFCKKILDIQMQTKFNLRIKNTRFTYTKNKFCLNKMKNFRQKFSFVSKIKYIFNSIVSYEKRYGITFDKILQFNTKKYFLFYFYYFIRDIEFKVLDLFDLTIANVDKYQYLINISKYRKFRYNIPLNKSQFNKKNKFVFAHENRLYKDRMNRNRISEIKNKLVKRAFDKYLFKKFYSKIKNYQVFYFKPLIDVNFLNGKIDLIFPMLRVTVYKNDSILNFKLPKLLNKNKKPQSHYSKFLNLIEVKNKDIHNDQNYDIYYHNYYPYKTREEFLERTLNKRIPLKKLKLNKDLFNGAKFNLYQDKYKTKNNLEYIIYK